MEITVEYRIIPDVRKELRQVALPNSGRSRGLEGARQGRWGNDKVSKRETRVESPDLVHNLVQKIEEKEMLSESFYETSVTLIPNQTKHKRKK